MAVKNLFACLPECSSGGRTRQGPSLVRGSAGAAAAPCRLKVAAHVTISIGVAAVVPSADARPEQLLAQADAHLYAAKQAGRNQVHAGNHEKVS